jgi:hypothetical protein
MTLRTNVPDIRDHLSAIMGSKTTCGFFRKKTLKQPDMGEETGRTLLRWPRCFIVFINGHLLAEVAKLSSAERQRVAFQPCYFNSRCRSLMKYLTIAILER